jgi:hypothetical protein
VSAVEARVEADAAAHALDDEADRRAAERPGRETPGARDARGGRCCETPGPR